MNDPPRVVWDSCVIIAAIQNERGKYDKIEPYIQDAESGNLQIVISEISVAEIHHLKELRERDVADSDQLKMIHDWLQNPYLIRVAVQPAISEEAGRIGRQYKIKPADSVILATAIRSGVREVHTFDGAGRKKGLIDFDGAIGDPPLRIMVPDHAQGTLFCDAEAGED